MAAKTTAQAGDWGVGSTWTGGVAPVAGDTVTINHNVTVSDAQDIGNSPTASGVVIAISPGKLLTIASGGYLTVRGSVTLNGTYGDQANSGGVLVQGGGTWEWDATAAASPTTTNYYALGASRNPGYPLFEAIGSAGNLAIVRSKDGGGAGWIDTSDYHWLKVTATYAQFIRIGEKRGGTIVLAIRGKNPNFSITNSEFIDCGPIAAQAVAANQVVIDNCKFTDTGTREVPDYTFDMMGEDSTITGAGVRTLSRCAFKRRAMSGSGNSAGFKAFTISQCAFEKREFWTHQPTSVSGCSFRSRDNSDLNRIGVLTQDSYFFLDTAVPGGNPKGLGPNGGSTVKGCVFECGPGVTDATGDGCFVATSGHINYIANLFLPWKGGNLPSFGSSINYSSAGPGTFSVEHCTWLSATTGQENGSIRYGETLTAPANVITAFRSNLAYAPVAGEGFLAHKSPSTDSATDAITPANCNYNGVCNPYSGSAGPGYHNFRTPPGNAMFSTAVGANDVIGDPQFVDRTRNIATWAAARGYTVASDYATQSDDAWTALMVDPSRIPDLVSWVKAGWAPTNTVFKDADYETATAGVSPTGGWIGAVEGVATITAGRSRIVNAGATGGSTRGVLINSGGV